MHAPTRTSPTAPKKTNTRLTHHNLQKKPYPTQNQVQSLTYLKESGKSQKIGKLEQRHFWQHI